MIIMVIFSWALALDFPPLLPAAIFTTVYWLHCRNRRKRLARAVAKLGNSSLYGKMNKP